MSSGNMIAVPKELIDRIMRAFPDPSVTKADILTPTNDPDMVVKETFDRNILPLYSRKGGNPFFDKQGHVAEPGDTWKSIAAKYGVSADDLVIANPHIPPLTLSPGNFVLVPKKYGFNEFVEGIIHPDTNMNLQYDGDAAPKAEEDMDPLKMPPPKPGPLTIGGVARSSLNFIRNSLGRGAPAAPPTEPTAPPGMWGRASQWVGEIPVKNAALAAVGGITGALVGGVPGALYGGYQGAKGDHGKVIGVAAPLLGEAAAKVGNYFAPEWIPANVAGMVRGVLSRPEAQIMTGAGVNAIRAAANAEGGFKNRLGAAGLSLGASLLPGAAVAFADSQAGVSAVKTILDQFGLSSAVDPTSVLQIVKMFGPGALRMLFPPNIDPKLADSAIGRIVDSLYSSHLWGQYLRGPPAAPADTVPPGYVSTGNMTMIQPGDTNWPPPRDGLTEWAARGPAVTVMPPPVNNQSNGFTSWTPPTNTIPPNSIYDPFMSAQAGGDPYGQVVLGGGSPYSQVAMTSGPPYVDGSTAVVDPSAMGAYSINSSYYSPYDAFHLHGPDPRPMSTALVDPRSPYDTFDFSGPKQYFYAQNQPANVIPPAFAPSSAYQYSGLAAPNVGFVAPRRGSLHNGYFG
eukprot:jgi/Mesvir1/6348/Mv10213-RA.1